MRGLSNPVLGELIDPFRRRIDYLRVSVTDRCNFRCVYCMPERGVPFAPLHDLLTADEFARLVGVAARLGVTKVRVTGGEPTVRPDIVGLVSRLARTPGVRDLSMTTNGQLLAGLARPLADAGLMRVNVSLDTLQPERFASVARGRGDLESVLNGIRSAREAGLAPVKINVVAMRHVNDDEFVSFAKWTLREPVHVRFIELMPIAWDLGAAPTFEPAAAHPKAGLLRVSQIASRRLDSHAMLPRAMPNSEVRAAIERELGALVPSFVETNGPARSYILPNAQGTIGFISQISDDVCSDCNRLRLTADGCLRPCLMSDGELSLRDACRSGASDDELAELFLQVVDRKPARHYLAEGQRAAARTMSQIGG